MHKAERVLYQYLTPQHYLIYGLGLRGEPVLDKGKAFTLTNH